MRSSQWPEWFAAERGGDGQNTNTTLSFFTRRALRIFDRLKPLGPLWPNGAGGGPGLYRRRSSVANQGRHEPGTVRAANTSARVTSSRVWRAEAASSGAVRDLQTQRRHNSTAIEHPQHPPGAPHHGRPTVQASRKARTPLGQRPSSAAGTKGEHTAGETQETQQHKNHHWGSSGSSGLTRQAHGTRRPPRRAEAPKPELASPRRRLQALRAGELSSADPATTNGSRASRLRPPLPATQGSTTGQALAAQDRSMQHGHLGPGAWSARACWDISARRSHLALACSPRRDRLHPGRQMPEVLQANTLSSWKRR